MNQSFKDGVLMTLHINKWTGAKKLDPADLGLTADQIPDFMKLGRKLLIPEEERNVFVQIENNARNALERESFAFPAGGARFVPRVRLLDVDAKLKEYKAAFNDAVQSLLTRYHDIQEKMFAMYPEHRGKLEMFYPAAHRVERAFSFDWLVFEIGPVGMREGETVEAYERFKAELQIQFDQFLGDVVLDLRFKVQETCLRVADRVSKGEIINGNSIKSLNTCIDRFKSLNFIGDTKIEVQLDALRATLQTVDAGKLKENESLQKELGAQAAAIAKEAADITDISDITGQYKRHLEMD